MKKIITFDFDNTIGMSYMDVSQDPAKPVFQTYNDKIIEKIKELIDEGNDIYLVTSRKKNIERYFPKQSIPFHLKQLGLDEYFLPQRLFYTNGRPKKEILKKLGSELHYDDDIEEHLDSLEEDYVVKQPLDHFEDSDAVGKIVIFDELDNILILQRSDEGHYWDLPGGHIKNIELARGEDGLKDGSKREIYEETGLLVPFLKPFMKFDLHRHGLIHKIVVFLSKIDGKSPHVRLDLQELVENIDYKWVTLDELEGLMEHSTSNLRKIYDELAVSESLFEQNEPFQRKMKAKHRKMKKKLVGFGKNKHFGGGKGHKRPKMSRSKSAPPMGEAKDPFLDQKTKIKVKINKNLDEKRKKRRKKRKKRQKRNKYHWGVGSWYYGGGYGDASDGGGDGGGGGGE